MFLKEIIRIGTLDLDYIDEYHAAVADIIDYSTLENITLGQIDANVILNEIFTLINYEVFTRIKNKLKSREVTLSTKARDKVFKACEKRIDEFSPFLNCLDSWFQNELDSVTIKERQLDDIADDVLPLLIENILA